MAVNNTNNINNTAQDEFVGDENLSEEELLRDDSASGDDVEESLDKKQNEKFSNDNMRMHRLREMMIMSEVLSKPVSMRGRNFKKGKHGDQI